LTLCDTGPLVALVDRNDTHHTTCAEALPSLRGPLVTTWPCFTEAMYLLWRADGLRAQEGLWAFLERQALELHLQSAEEQARMRALMSQYRDRPMDLADASVVAAAEALGQTRVFSLDADFRIYRLHSTVPFEVVP
jgi:uncharacterized protein